MIGLKRGTVKLLPHNKKWKKLFAKEKAALENKLNGLVVDIQHIGSTSIFGIPAKPIIDMSLGLRKLRDAKKLIKPLATLGYEWRKGVSGPNQQLFVKGPEEKRTHYLHVMRYNGGVWRHDILFRDYLRKDPPRAKDYAVLKEKLAAQYADNRGTYTKKKAEFILETIKIAKKRL